MRFAILLLSALFLTACSEVTISAPSAAPRAVVPAPAPAPTGPACASALDCRAGQQCCGGACVAGDCCSAADCDGRACVGNLCQPCTDAAQCGDGKVCCGGLCQAGACCTSADCGGGQACVGRQCAACQLDAECGDGQRCCGGACVAGDCCDSSSCGGAACVDHRCGACRADADCGPGQACADGRCAARLAQAASTPCASDAECPALSKCCNGGCLSGECCSDAECPAPTQCLQNACQQCTSNAQCGAGSVCCGGTCTAGACCPGALCGNGRVCSGGQCGACTSDGDCGTGRVCCGGTCQAGNCCSTSQCGAYVCQANSCSACSNNGDCGANSLCCRGACIANGQCCSSSDCSDGQVCTNNRCTSCAADSECGPGGKCCGGSCKSGDCCSNADCAPGTVCNPSGFCGSCSSDSQCAAGQKCCDGACVNGTCCLDSECGAGRLCRANSCQGCTTNADCGRAQVCCNGGCQSGNCCSPTGAAVAVPECGGLVCSGNSCTRCASDTQCGANAKCCRGACYDGISCCGDGDCRQGERCVDGACQGCRSDRDCGALNCCKDCSGAGRCLAVCEVEQPFTNRSGFDLGTYQGTTSDGSSQPMNSSCIAGALCRTSTAFKPPTPYVWVVASGEGRVARHDTRSGARSAAWPTGVVATWPTGAGVAPGDNPGATAVNVYDGTLWVANRGTRTGKSGLAHLAFDGSMLCFAEVPGGASGVTLDSRGDAWVGSLNGSVLYKISGTQLTRTSSPATCKRLASLTVPMRPVALATDELNRVWAVGSDGRIIAADPSAVLVTRVFDANCPANGLAVDATALWVSCASTGVVSRVDRATGARTAVTVGGSPGGLVSAADGFVYVGTGTGSMVKIERRTLAVTPLALAGTSSNVLATVDSLGQAWAIDASGPVSVVRTTAATERFAGSSQGQSPGGDLTGQQFVNVGLAPARWNAIYDATYPTPRWLALRLAANTPAGTTVSVRVRSAASLVDLAAAGWTDWKTVFPLDLSRLNLPSRRYLEIDTSFSIIQPGTTPQVSLLAALWAPLENPICLCPDGYVRLGSSCVDVDECATNNGGCSENAVCTNTPGGRTCRCKAGFSGDGLVCTDVDECQVGNGNCAGDQTCTNTAGGAVCCPRCNAWDTVARACVPSIEFFSAQVAVTTPTVYVRPPGVTSTYFSPTAFAGQATVNTRTPVTYALSGNPAWLSINPTTGALTGSPTSNGTDPGTRTVTVRATTVCGSSATATFEVRVVANQWCGDGVVNGNEACDTQSRSCTATNIAGFPAYCQGTYTGVQYCDAACTGYGACSATAPTVSANSFGQCSNAAIRLDNYFCCVMDACRNDSCCNGQNGTNSNLQSGYSQMSFLPNAQGNGNCRLGRSGNDWQVAVSHTTASYRCWR